MKLSKSTFALEHMKPNPGAKKSKRRLGRGESSGAGKTAGRGGKGQTARTGGKVKARFEGGQTPLYRRIPKFGFVAHKRVIGKNTFKLVKLADLNELKDGASIDLTTGVLTKIVSGGELSKKVTVKVHAVTKSARAAIEKSGGSIEIVTI